MAWSATSGSAWAATRRSRSSDSASIDYPRLGFLDGDLWGDTYRVLLDSFDPDDRDWRDLLFRLWVARVLSYTVTEAVRGYDAAIEYLNTTIEHYRRGSGHDG